jgi:predicted amidohydrolase YtcJ
MNTSATRADLIIHGAVLFDGAAVVEAADTIAIVDGRIAAIGTESQVRAKFPVARETLNAAGALVSPSFTDAHVHPVQGGMERMQCDLTEAVDAAETLDLIGRYAHANPELDWILGSGWHMPHFPGGRPTADALESVAPGRAVFLANADHHGAWVSFEALRRMGVDARTPDPVDGVIDRNADGTPSGTLQEGAMTLAERVLPSHSLDDYVAAIDTAQRYLASFGVTGWHDAIVGPYAGASDSTAAYRAAVERGVLRAHVTGALWLGRDLSVDTIDETVGKLLDRKRQFEVGPLRASAIKIMQDGVVETETAALKAPYSSRDSRDSHQHRHTGQSHFDPHVLSAIVPKLALAGFQLHFHAIGDRALAECLDAVAAARAAGDDGRTRHHVAHLQVVDPVDIRRMAELGVSANLQMLWACDDEQAVTLSKPALGPDRYAAQYPFSSIAKAGVPLAAGSDWPVSTPDPWQAISVAVTRTEPGSFDQARRAGSSRAESFAPAERLSLASALGAYTRGSAELVGMPRGSGRIAIGSPADLAVHDRNPFALPASDLHRVRVRTTLLGGEVLHEAR